VKVATCETKKDTRLSHAHAFALKALKDLADFERVVRLDGECHSASVRARLLPRNAKLTMTLCEARVEASIKGLSWTEKMLRRRRWRIRSEMVET
jgi:hypothetical protein